MSRPIDQLDAREFQHAFDSAALDALRGTAGLDTLIRMFVKHGLERLFRIQYTGSNLRVTANNYPELLEILTTASTTLAMPAPPQLYLEWGGAINASTIGAEQPIVVLDSGCVDRLSPLELSFVLGHEVGHVKCEHVVYHLLAQSICSLGEMVGDFTMGFGNLLTMPIRSALHRWSRMSELSADRAGLLACQDIDSALSVMVKMAGLPASLNDRVCLPDFIQQAQEFEALDFEVVSKWMKMALHSTQTHPWTVLRASELLKWHQSGDYQAVLDRTTRDRGRKRTIDGRAFCRNCSYRLDGTEAFCPNCGQELLTALSAVAS
ncbi:MAG TPA: M48 family metallopeptidase [Chthoniobacteraceae bacterium]|jgi:Zn-dependent protease with chaperone function|nr:M48 family metallopeptidase [Chthoniobacteraceae bacterium]